MNVWVHRRMVVIVLGVAFGLALVFALTARFTVADPEECIRHARRSPGRLVS
jgi:hypothetical protein